MLTRWRIATCQAFSTGSTGQVLFPQQYRLMVNRGYHLMILKHIFELENIKKKKICSSWHAFMLNDCKYLCNMYSRYSTLNLILLLICITIMIIMYYVWADKMTFFVQKVWLLCTVGSIDVFFIAVFWKLFKCICLGSSVPWMACLPQWGDQNQYTKNQLTNCKSAVTGSLKETADRLRMSKG